MGITKLVAGSGYEYLTRQVAAMDSTELGRTPLAVYYQAKGEAPGRWVGSGLTGVGIKPGDVVTAEQMGFLFGRGEHPLAAQRVAALGPEASERARRLAAKLGQKFPEFTATTTPYRIEVARRLEEWNRQQGRKATAAVDRKVRARIRTEVGVELFRTEHGRQPLTRNELYSFIATASKLPPRGVAGFDLTFSPVKSVSALWALADPDLAKAIAQAHHESVAETLSWLENSVLYTRRGTHGVRRVKTRGLIAAAFTHRDSRAGDPDLHTHVAVANKVQDATDGTWLTIHAKPLYDARVTASEHYNTVLQGRLEALGLRFAPPLDWDRTKRPVFEIVGMPQQLLDRWSVRRRDIVAATKELSRQFREDHGRPPTPIEKIGLSQQATLETRDRKHAPISEAEQRQRWFREAVRVLGRDGFDQLRRAVFGQRAATPPVMDADWFDNVAQWIVRVVETDRADWTENHIRSEAFRQARALSVPVDQLQPVTERLVCLALDEFSIPLTPVGDGIDEPAELRRPDGSSVYAEPGSLRYSSARILSAERDLVAAGELTGGRVADATSVGFAEIQALANRTPLNAGQRELVWAMATSDRRLLLAIAPAGTGKTTAMRTLAAAWINSFGNVLGLAPSAAAADQLEAQLGGADAETLHKLAWHITHPANAWPGWASRVGKSTMLIIDEAGMADTLTLHTVVTWALDRGATIRLVGDPGQLGAIGAGGVLRDIEASHGVLRLDDIVRFTEPIEAAATLDVRDGNPGALGYYFDHDRIHVGDPTTVIDQVFDAWTTDRNAGIDAIMVAPTRELVSELNALARSHRLGGHRARWEVPLRDGNHASKGDVVVTRDNDRTLRYGRHDWVRNGDRWTVTGTRMAGSVTVQHTRTGRTITLPASYVRASVELGYATTIHGAQGTTADTCHGILTGAESRQQLYTMASRGRNANHVYVQVTGDGDPHSTIEPTLFEPPTARELLQDILARDDAPRSATTLRRALAKPGAPLGHAVDCYLDALAFAAEKVLDPELLAQIDLIGEEVPWLGDAPAWPTLRDHLVLIAAAGEEPLLRLNQALAEGPLKDAHDKAAVVDHRLDLTDLGSADRGPLSWLPSIPVTIQTSGSWGYYLQRRADLVKTLAGRVREDVHSTSAVPAWAKALPEPVARDVIAEIEQWRAAHGVPDADLRPTGPATHHPAEVRVQRRLDRLLVTDRPEVGQWTEFLRGSSPLLKADPDTHLLAQELARRDPNLARLPQVVTEMVDDWPLPTEQPADAMRFRLDRYFHPEKYDTWDAEAMAIARESERRARTPEHLRHPPQVGGPSKPDRGYSIDR